MPTIPAHQHGWTKSARPQSTHESLLDEQLETDQSRKYPVKAPQKTHQRVLSFFILLGCIFLTYSNTWFADWHLDDYPNIVKNNVLHLETLSPSSLYRTFFSNPTRPEILFRPVAGLSFALNWLMGRDNVFGYHLFNIGLHFLTSFLLYLNILLLLNTPGMKAKNLKNKHAIALFSALLWALNPIQTQAVTYIVQRMALLAGFFYIGALFFYLKGRLHQHGPYRQVFYFILSLCCFMLALGSKENAITLPLALIFIEFIFFNAPQKSQWKYIFYFLLPFIVITAAGLLLLTDGKLTSIFAGYDQRSFTLLQRLLTEPRIIVFYISQIFYPVPSRFSLDHDIVISTALNAPFSTPFALGLLLILTIGPLLYYKKYPITAFALLFFILNHVIESSFIPLELIFEHRNYLPSMFLFLPVSMATEWLVDRYGSQTTWVRAIIYSFCLLLVAEFGLSTFQRNNVWATEQSLWEDGLKKAPQSSRPYINLAFVYRQKGYNKAAFELCRQSLDKTSPTPEKDRMRAYNNMGIIMMDYNNFPLAVKYFSKAIEAKTNENSRYYLHKALVANGHPEAAKRILDKLLTTHPNDSHLLTSMAITLTVMKQYRKAEMFLNRALDNSKQDMFEQLQATICLGSLFSRRKQYAKAKNTFLSALSVMQTGTPALCLLGNELLQNNRRQASNIRRQLLTHIPAQQLLTIVTTSYRHNLMFPVDTKIIAEYITKGIKETPPSQQVIQDK